MAVLTGPLMSLDASGTIGKTVTYSKWKGRHYARSRVVPKNPKSVMQTGVRAMMGWLSKRWTSISANNKLTWAALAASKEITKFNAFVGANLSRWQINQTPTDANPAAEASAGLTITTQTLTGAEGYATIEMTPSGATSIAGFIIFRDDAEIVSPNWANAIAVVSADGANKVTYTDTPLEAKTWHYRTAAFNVDGVIGTIKTDGTAVVT